MNLKLGLIKNCLLFVLAIITFILFTSTSFARNINPLLKCLAKEELSIHHQKLIGPIYQLNQTLINELSKIGGISLKEKYHNLVCNAPLTTPAIELLKTMLLRKSSEIFIITGGNEHENAIKKSSVESLLQKIPTFFFTFIAAIEAKSTTPECLKQKIPELDFFFTRFHYLGGKYSSQELAESKDKISNIFYSIKNISSIVRYCNNLAKKKKNKK